MKPNTAPSNTTERDATAERSPIFRTVQQFCEHNPAFTVGGIRHLLFTKGDKAEEAGVIVRYGRKLLIDEGAFLSWIKDGGARQIAGRAGK